MRLRVCALALLFACRPSDPKDPSAWLKRLSDSDPRTRQQAVQELRKLKARQAAPQVAQLLKDVMVREQAAAALRDIGGADEVPALLDAVDTTVGAGSDTATRSANRTNARIAEALGEIGDPRAGPTLLRLARSKDDYVRLEAVQALGEVKFKEAVPELSLLVDDPSAPPLLVKKAVVALGHIGDPAAIPALQHALVLERQGVSLLPEASYALFQLGPAAVPPLIRVAKDEDPAYLKWARENNRAPAGTYAKAALVLGDLGDQRAVPVLLERLRYKDPDPLPGTARLLTNLVRQFAANALGRLRSKDAAAPILALVQTRDPQDLDLVSFASESLVWIGDRAQAKELMKRAESGDVRLRLVAAQGRRSSPTSRCSSSSTRSARARARRRRRSASGSSRRCNSGRPRRRLASWLPPNSRGWRSRWRRRTPAGTLPRAGWTSSSTPSRCSARVPPTSWAAWVPARRCRPWCRRPRTRIFSRGLRPSARSNGSSRSPLPSRSSRPLRRSCRRSWPRSRGGFNSLK